MGFRGVGVRLGIALLVGALVEMASGAAHASATLVQNNTATGTTSVTATWAHSGGVTAGHLLVATVMTPTGSTITAPGSWTLIGSADNAGKVQVAIYYIENCGAKAQNATETFTPSLTGGTTLRLMEFSGVLATGALDASGTATGGLGSDATVSTSGSVMSSPELGVAILAHQIDDAANLAGIAPYADVSADLQNATGVEDTIYNMGVTSGGASTASASASATHSWAGAIATFKEAPLYWRGGLTGCASGSLFSAVGCWSTSSGGASAGVAPGTSDRAIFDGNGPGNCALSSAATTQAGSITTTSTYPGTITQSTRDLSMASDLSIGGGTFTGRSGQNIATNFGGSYNGGIVVTGGTFNGNGAALAVRSLYVTGGTFTAGSGNFSTNNGGVVSLSGGASTFSSGNVTMVGTFDVSGSSTSVTFASGAPTVAGLATFTGGTVTFGSGQLTLNGGLDVEGANVTLGSSGSTTTVTGTATVGSGTLSFTNGSAGTDFKSSLVFTQSGGTINMNGATVELGWTVTTGSDDAFVQSGGIFHNTTAGGTLQVGSAGGGGGNFNQSGSGATYNSVSTATETFNGKLIVDGAMTVGTASMAGTGVATRRDVTINSGGTLTLSSAGFSFTGPTAMIIDGALDAAGIVSFSPVVTLSGTFNAGSATSTFTDVVTMAGTSVFDGGTGTTTFSLAPTLTAGTFTVGGAGSTGSVIFTLGATFASGMTLAFPTSGGTLSTPGGQTLTMNGTVTSSAGSATTPPKIARSSGATGIAVAFGGGASNILDIDGLEFDDAVATGVTIADAATYTLLRRLTFKSNVANSIVSGATHLAITSSNAGGTKLITVPGCFFDATAQYNVTLSGVSGSTGVRAFFELQSSTTNGARAGESFDLDADTNDDNIADTTAANRYGSVVEWTYASPADTAGTALGPPVAAYDWNTFAFYGVYVSFKNIGGAGTSDRFWMRKTDGSAAYHYDVPSSSGDIVGGPRWDAINEVTANLDVNGDGDKLDTDVRVVYIGTSLGHIIKLIDTGAAFTPPTTGNWTSDFTNAGVGTITTALVSDGTNLYFGGTNASAQTRIFGVQIATGANEKTLQKTVTPTGTGAITTAPAIGVYAGSTYLFIGSAAVTSQAYIYRVQISPGAAIENDYTGATTNVNGLNLINNRLCVVTQSGRLYELDASNFGTGGFTTYASFPYTSGGAAIGSAPYVDGATSYAYFGDTAGKVHVVTPAGAALPGYPYTIAGTPQLTSTPYYKKASGTIAVGGADGYAYFINRHDASSNPQIRKKYFVGTGSVTAISYDSNTLQYMAASSDGRMTYINATDVGSDSDGVE